jgi:hypothetical protein
VLLLLLLIQSRIQCQERAPLSASPMSSDFTLEPKVHEDMPVLSTRVQLTRVPGDIGREANLQRVGI